MGSERRRAGDPEGWAAAEDWVEECRKGADSAEAVGSAEDRASAKEEGSAVDSVDAGEWAEDSTVD